MNEIMPILYQSVIEPHFKPIMSEIFNYFWIPLFMLAAFCGLIAVGIVLLVTSLRK